MLHGVSCCPPQIICFLYKHLVNMVNISFDRDSVYVFQVHMCRRKVSTRSCPFYNNTEGNLLMLGIPTGVSMI